MVRRGPNCPPSQVLRTGRSRGAAGLRRSPGRTKGREREWAAPGGHREPTKAQQSEREVDQRDPRPGADQHAGHSAEQMALRLDRDGPVEAGRVPPRRGCRRRGSPRRRRTGPRAPPSDYAVASGPTPGVGPDADGVVLGGARGPVHRPRGDPGHYNLVLLRDHRDPTAGPSVPVSPGVGCWSTPLALLGLGGLAMAARRRQLLSSLSARPGRPSQPCSSWPITRLTPGGAAPAAPDHRDPTGAAAASPSPLGGGRSVGAFAGASRLVGPRAGRRRPS